MIFVNDRKITLNQIIANKEKNTAHLQQFVIPQFIKFCSLHQQIVNVFGNSRICKKSALMCTTNCQKHKRQDSKHEFLDVKEFLTMVKDIKDKYIQYHGTLLSKAIPDFIGKLKIIVLQFIEGLEKWDRQTSVVDNFLYYTRNKKILDLLTVDISENDLSNFSCRDMCELYYISQKIKTKKDEDFEIDMFEDLKDLFYRSLVSYRLLPQPRQKQKQQDVIRGGLDETIRKIKDLQTILEKNIKADVRSKSNLAIVMTENVNVQANSPNQNHDKINNALKIHLGISSNEKPQVTLARRQQQINEKLVQFIQILQQYMRKCHNPKIKLALKISSQNTQFWQFLFEKILNVIREDERKSSLNHLQIYSTQPKQISKLFSQYVTKEDEVLSINLRVQEIQKTAQIQDTNSQKQKVVVKPSEGEKHIKQYLNKQNFKSFVRATFKNFAITFF